MRHSSKSDLLNYNLFTDAARSAVWGDGTQGTSTLSSKVQRNKPWVATVYGRIPAGQNVPVGLYSDTLTVTIIW
jgi:spore coat protein U-like protein